MQLAKMTHDVPNPNPATNPEEGTAHLLNLG
jgi:hypothetical protein